MPPILYYYIHTIGAHCAFEDLIKAILGVGVSSGLLCVLNLIVATAVTSVKNNRFASVSARFLPTVNLRSIAYKAGYPQIAVTSKKKQHRQQKKISASVTLPFYPTISRSLRKKDDRPFPLSKTSISPLNITFLPNFIRFSHIQQENYFPGGQKRLVSPIYRTVCCSPTYNTVFWRQ